MDNARCARVKLMSWMKSLRRLCYKPRALDIVIAVHLYTAHKFSSFTDDFFPTFARPFGDAVVGNCKSSMHSVYNKGSGVRSHICNFVAPERALFLCILSAAKSPAVSSCLSHTFAHPFSNQHSYLPVSVVVGQFANLLWDAFLWIAVQAIWQIACDNPIGQIHFVASLQQKAFIEGF